MKKILLIQCLLWGFIMGLYAQTPAKYWVQFKDKSNSPYSISNPQQFLSPRAIALRQQHHIAIVENDLPVNPQYIQQVMALDPKMILFTKSKWLNGITIYSQQDSIAAEIRKLPCVAFVERTNKLKEAEPDWHNRYVFSASGAPTIHYQSDVANNQDFDYGKSEEQIRLNNAHWLHRMGYRGENMLMMVMDGGFINADTLHFFNQLRDDNRLLGARNYVQPQESPFLRHTHGTMVLSCIASYIPGDLVGTAPMTQVYLCQTEDARSETKNEEDNWVAGLELADSLGCQVLNSSLGYTKFDDSTQVRTYKDLNGQVSRASIGATIAATKGLLICNSAGNEGDSKWKYIGAPADAKDILSVGAVDINGQRASFSSFGPTADGRVKPDACAVGRNTYVASTRGYSYRSNGTSFSSPVLSGMVTCLWEAFPDKTNYEIMDAVRRSGSRFATPDSAYGYGIPDFLRAYNYLLQPEPKDISVSFDSFVAAKGLVKIKVTSDGPVEITATAACKNGSSKICKKTYKVQGTQTLSVKVPKLSSKKKYEIVNLTLQYGSQTLHYVVGEENNIPTKISD